jgi:serine/threonine protein kinase
MTAHNTREGDIATRSNMVFDELWLESNDPAMMKDGNSSKDDSQAMPTATTISSSSSEESEDDAASATPVRSITGNFSNIEDRYCVDTCVLGTGHHGSVRECIDRTTGQRYAVKSICKNDPSVKEGALVREIMLLKEMGHGSIVQLVDVFEDAEYLHLVTDLCTGGELFDRIIQRNSTDNGVPCFKEDEAASIIYQILTAVSYMHKCGVVHRDLKPENILFETKDENSPIKLIDFGLSRKHYGSFGEPPMRSVVGTPYYIAPEVLRRNYDSSCDLWSVGVIAYILLCGYPPFNGKNNDETHASVLRGRYYFPSQEWKGTSRESRDFIRRLLQMDPRKRMSVEQALHHPWLARHAAATLIEMAAEERQDKLSTSSDENPVKSLRIPRRGSLLCGRISRGKVKSMFGR